MRVLIVLGTLGAFIFVGLIGVAVWSRIEARRNGPTDAQARVLLQQMARLLDHALADPMYRQSTRFEERAQELVGEVYGRDNIR